MRKAKKYGKGFKKECFFCKKKFTAFRKRGIFCEDCRPTAKQLKDEERREKKAKENLVKKIKASGNYEQFIDDIASAVLTKIRNSS